MNKNSLSESHINNTLKTNMLFSEFLGREISFHDVISKEQIIDILDSKMKNPELDPDKKWITTWNDYLGVHIRIAKYYLVMKQYFNNSYNDGNCNAKKYQFQNNLNVIVNFDFSFTTWLPT